VLITQTGGGCRATNYIALIRKALKDSGHADIPVISLSVAGGLDENNPGWNILKPGLLKRAVYALLYGDLLMKCLYRTRPYEAEKGAADREYEFYMSRVKSMIGSMDKRDFYSLCEDTIRTFDRLPLVNDRSKPRVGVVGEILVKFHPTANNQVVKVIENEGCEADVPGLVDFFLFGVSNQVNMNRELGTKLSSRVTHKLGIDFLEGMREPINKMLEKSERFEPYGSIFDLAAKASEVLSLCNTMGEGWLLTAEMCDLIESGTPNIIVCSPFACLPNHVVGKSVIKRLRQMHHESNIVAVDYDPGASEVNQLNRIKLMISVAKENQRQAQAAGDADASFTLHNDDDPTNRVIPNFEEYGHLRRKGELEDHIVNEGAPVSGGYAAYGTKVDDDGGITVGRGEGRIHLTREQLDEIEDAKRRAGVR
jgi:predicted nucleotide-binding protein (sugar kinase/HSP70/actin superfamily)